MSERIRVAIRGFVGRACQFQELVDVPEEDEALDKLIEEITKRHGAQMAAHELHMIEIEFLDDPDPEKRFFRFGTDPAGMVAPVALPITQLYEPHTEERQRAIDYMRAVAESGRKVIVGTIQPLHVGVSCGRSGNKHLVVKRRATRAEFLQHCPPGAQQEASGSAPFYWELEVQE
jgi:hypothetical protein